MNLADPSAVDESLHRFESRVEVTLVTHLEDRLAAIRHFDDFDGVLDPCHHRFLDEDVDTRVDTLAKRIDMIPRTIDGETYHLWAQKREVARLGKVKPLITRKESREEDEAPSVK